MKNFLLLLCLPLLLLTLGHAQSFYVFPNDSVVDNIDPNRAVEQDIRFVNSGQQASTLRWTVTTQTYPQGWWVTLCDNAECHSLPWPGDTMRTLQPGDTSFLHLTVVPNNIAGSLLVIVNVWDSLNPSINADVTFIVNATATAVSPALLRNQISIFPSPASDLLHLRARTGALERGTAKLYDLKGRLVLSQAIGTVQDAALHIRTVEAGIYLLRYESKSGTLTEKVMITR